MAAGVAAAGAGAVALTALTPATQPELAAAPVASHQIVLTAGDFDLAGNLGTLWNGVKSVPAYATLGYVQGSTMAAGNKLGRSTLGWSLNPFTGTPESTPKSSLGANVANVLDNVIALELTGVLGVAPVGIAVNEVANNLGPIPGAVVSGALGIQGNVVFGQGKTTLHSAESVHRVLAKVEQGDAKGVVNTIADRRLDLRKNLATYGTTAADKDQLKSGALKDLRTAVDGARDGVSTAVINKLPAGALRNAANDAKTEVGKVRAGIRDAVDKVGSTLKKTADNVDKKVKDATD